MSEIEKGDDWFRDILSAGNAVSKKWARRILGRRKLAKFLRVFQNPATAASSRIKPEQAAQIAAIPEEDRQKILAALNIGKAVAVQYDAMCSKLANKFAVRTGRAGTEEASDLAQEARIGLLKAVRGYTDPEICFGTYCWTAIFNEISRYAQENCHIVSGVNGAILAKFEACRDSMRQEGLHPTIEEVVERMEGDKTPADPEKAAKKKRRAVAKITKMIVASNCKPDSDSEKEDTFARVLIDRRRDLTMDSELLDRLAKINTLTLLESDAFKVSAGYPDAPRTQKEVARIHGKTPQAVTAALKRARQKIRAALDDFRP